MAHTATARWDPVTDAIATRLRPAAPMVRGMQWLRRFPPDLARFLEGLGLGLGILLISLVLGSVLRQGTAWGPAPHAVHAALASGWATLGINGVLAGIYGKFLWSIRPWRGAEHMAWTAAEWRWDPRCGTQFAILIVLGNLLWYGLRHFVLGWPPTLGFVIGTPLIPAVAAVGFAHQQTSRHPLLRGLRQLGLGAQRITTAVPPLPWRRTAAVALLTLLDAVAAHPSSAERVLDRPFPHQEVP